MNQIAQKVQPTAIPLDRQPISALDKLGGFKAASDFAACLLPLLRALQWRGNPRHIAESLPHFAETLDLTGLRNVMATLNFQSRPERLRLKEIDRRLVPCLFVPDDGPALVVLSTDGKIVTCFDGESEETVEFERPRMRGIAYFFSHVSKDEAPQGRTGWFRSVLERFRGLFWQALGVTLLLNVISLCTPLFVMSIYDKVISTKSTEMLLWFLCGISIALVTDWVLRAVRSRVLAFIGARLDHIMGNAIFQHLLLLPPSFTERATVGSQVSRIKDFESVREFFTGSLAMIMMELPFAVLYFAAIGLLGGAVAAVPVIGMIAFLVMSWALLPIVKNNVSRFARAGARRQEFLVETVGKMRGLKIAGAEAQWLKRYKDMSARAAIGGFRNAQFTALLQTLSNILVIMSGVGTITFGVHRVLNGDMTMGGLIASMMLVWRVLSPFQTGFMMITRVEQVRSAIRQIDGLMSLKPERDPRNQASPLRNLKGRVSFARVSIRYTGDAEPALVGVSFDVEPGEVVCVVGRNGSGKSTVMKLVMGLYIPQAGSVRIDNQDIRQLDPIELRHAIAYVPQNGSLFFGSIAQNIRLANPVASDDDMYRACEQADVLHEILEMPRGFDTRVGDSTSDHLSASFVQKLSLARAYIKRAPLILFDEPVNGLDFEGDRRFQNMVEQMRGHSTIFIVTHRPSHLRMADKVLVFEAGYLRLGGPAAEVLPRIPKDFL
jgi:ATP-binding cassette subfamily C protein LapB